MRHQNFVAVYLLPRYQGKIALSGRQNTGFFDQHYGLISGHVEAGESFMQAMIREAREEAGLELLPEHLRVVHVLHSTRAKSPEDDDQYVSVFFAVDLLISFDRKP